MKSAIIQRDFFFNTRRYFTERAKYGSLCAGTLTERVTQMLRTQVKILLNRLGQLPESLRNILLPAGDGGLVFKRYGLERPGWLGLVFRRFVLTERETLDLSVVSREAVTAVQGSIDDLVATTGNEISTALNNNIARFADHLRGAVDGEMLQHMTERGEQLSSGILVGGRAATQAVHRSIVEAAGAVANEKFQEIVQQVLAQLIAYAREETGVEPKTKFALPDGTRFFYPGDPVSLFVIEEKPRVRTILWDGKQVTLSFPYVVFPVYLQGDKFEVMQVFFRNEPLATPADSLFLPPLPDIMREATRNGSVVQRLRWKYWLCFPGPTLSRGSPAAVVHSAQHVFWSSNFNSTHWDSRLQRKVNGMEDFSIETWRTQTTDAPQDVLHTDWLQSGFTIEMLANDLKRAKDPFKPRKAMSNLERYVRGLSERVTTGMQEAVLQAIADDKRPAEARAAFDTALRTAVKDADLGTHAARLLRAELVNACKGADFPTMFREIVTRASGELDGIMTPAMDSAVAIVAERLRGE
ncbi:MAG TPA: hypothetical protein VN495_04410 [Candidatus Paceibacterota bacterium]|nr:hypothetical protein [Candidatus Paceibacterota bacterium]